METAIINTYNVPAEKELAPSLFDEFVRWIDRSAKTSTTYIINLRQFVAWMRYAGIVRPQRADVISYRQWLEAEHEAIQLDDTAPDGWTYRANGAGAPVMVKCKPNTVQQYLRSVKQFFAWTAANGYYPNIALNIHAPKVDHDTHRKDSLTAAEVMSIETDITGRASEREAEAALSAKDKAGKIQERREPLSPKSIRLVHGVLSKALNTAVRVGYLKQNASELCVTPKLEKKEISPLTDAQIEGIAKTIADTGACVSRALSVEEIQELWTAGTKPSDTVTPVALRASLKSSKVL